MKLIIIVYFILISLTNALAEPKINAPTAILMDHNSGKFYLKEMQIIKFTLHQ